MTEQETNSMGEVTENAKSDLEQRIARLPAWVRTYIRHLETRNQPMLEELTRARRELEVAKTRAKRLSESNEAILELLRRAGEGGIDWGKTVVSILEGYDIFQLNNTENSEKTKGA